MRVLKIVLRGTADLWMRRRHYYKEQRDIRSQRLWILRRQHQPEVLLGLSMMGDFRNMARFIIDGGANGSNRTFKRYLLCPTRWGTNLAASPVFQTMDKTAMYL